LSLTVAELAVVNVLPKEEEKKWRQQAMVGYFNMKFV
jgi:hypothetical protein